MVYILVKRNIICPYFLLYSITLINVKYLLKTWTESGNELCWTPQYVFFTYLCLLVCVNVICVQWSLFFFTSITCTANNTFGTLWVAEQAVHGSLAQLHKLKTFNKVFIHGWGQNSLDHVICLFHNSVLNLPSCSAYCLFVCQCLHTLVKLAVRLICFTWFIDFFISFYFSNLLLIKRLSMHISGYYRGMNRRVEEPNLSHFNLDMVSVSDQTSFLSLFPLESNAAESLSLWLYLHLPHNMNFCFRQVLTSYIKSSIFFIIFWSIMLSNYPDFLWSFFWWTFFLLLQANR